MRASALSHHEKCTSLYTFHGEFRHAKTSLLMEPAASVPLLKLVYF